MNDLIKKLSIQTNRLILDRVKTDMLNSVTDFLLLLDSGGSVIFANKPFLEYLGYQLHEIEGIDFSTLLHSDDRQRTAEAFEHVMENGELGLFENRYRAKSGSYLWISWLYSKSIENLTFGISRAKKMQAS